MTKPTVGKYIFPSQLESYNLRVECRQNIWLWVQWSVGWSREQVTTKWARPKPQFTNKVLFSLSLFKTMPGDLDSPTRFYSLSSKNQLMGPKGELDGIKSACVVCTLSLFSCFLSIFCTFTFHPLGNSLNLTFLLFNNYFLKKE